MPVKVIDVEWGRIVFVTVRVKVSLTVFGDASGAVEVVVNVPRLTLLGVVAVDEPNDV